MAAASIHIGVNRPGGAGTLAKLTTSEDYACRMAEVAFQAGYESTMVLRGAAATRNAVHDALTRTAGWLNAGDVLFISFAGHGTRQRDRNRDERSGWDEAWCLADGLMLDDQLVGYWRMFEPGVRIVAVVESCFGAGTGREGQGSAPFATPPATRRPVYRGLPTYRGAAQAVNPVGPCIAEAPQDAEGIRASLLLLAAATKEQPAQEGLYSKSLLEVWKNGDFEGSYCDLHQQVSAKVMAQHDGQQPQILMHGTADLGFPLEPAFRVPPGASGGAVRYRGWAPAHPQSHGHR